MDASGFTDYDCLMSRHLQALSDMKHLTNLEHLSIKRSMIDLDVALTSSQACCFWTCVGTLQNLKTLEVCNMDFGLDVKVCGPNSIAQLTQIRYSSHAGNGWGLARG